MDDLLIKIEETKRYIRNKTELGPEIGIILGTGLGRLASDIEKETVLSYDEIPNFAVSTVETHVGKLIFGTLSKKRVVAMQGRFHYYEGYTMEDITFPVKVMRVLGAKVLIVSNACGGLNPQFNRGDIMVITDHINLLPDNPLRGKNIDKLGARFPDMFEPYDRKLIKLTEEIALTEKIPIKKGVYIILQGPNLETAAEYRFLRIIGGDVVGMSTVPEVIVARHMRMRVVGFSIITDMGLPNALKPVNLKEIIKTANRAEPSLTTLIRKLVAKI